MAQRAELDYLIYNDPLAYAELILNGEPEEYLKNVAGSHGLPDNNPDTRRCDCSESLSDELLLLYTCVSYCLIFRVLHLFGAKE